MGMSVLMLAPRSFHICTGIDCRLSLTCLYDYQMAKMSVSFYCPRGDFHLVLLFLVLDPGIYCQNPLGKSVISIATMLNLL